MRKPETDYRKLRFSNLHSPQFRHLELLLGWVLYFALYVLTERLIPPERCHVIHCPWDDRIPFCEVFVTFYVLWYALIAGSLGYFLLYSVDSFKKLQTYILITQLLATAVYILYPSRQELRPTAFPRENFLTDVLGMIYTVDTPTGVFPSLHVAISIGIASVWLRERSVKPWIRGAIAAFCFGVCLSVAFVKQHSVLDAFAAIPVCMVAEWLVFFRGKHGCISIFTMLKYHKRREDP